MKVVLCNGGLGNQAFQYIFSRFIELAGGADCYLDDSAFFHKRVQHNGFEMKKVFPACKPRLLSECFTEDVWKYMVQKKQDGESIVQQWKDAGENFVLVAETSDYQYDGNTVMVPTNQFLPWLAAAKGDIYYHGYWINPNYLKGEYKKILREELEFAPLIGKKNRDYEKQIMETSSVALHIRRGDFIRMGWDMPAKVYASGVSAMKKAVSTPHFFIFSDDLEWCEENLEQMELSREEVTLVEGNRGMDSYIDMQLMSYCKNVVLVTASSFSYLAALLNRNESIVVVNGTDREI